MIQAWRAGRAAYADLAGEGARRHGGRWNSPGLPMVYLAEHPALAVLAVRVHLDLPPDLLPDDYVLMRVDLPDEPPEEVAAERSLRQLEGRGSHREGHVVGLAELEGDLAAGVAGPDDHHATARQGGGVAVRGAVQLDHIRTELGADRRRSTARRLLVDDPGLKTR